MGQGALEVQFPCGVTGDVWSRSTLEAGGSFPCQGAVPYGDCATVAAAGSCGLDTLAESERQNWGVASITSVVITAV